MSPEAVYIDSTHIKANANINRKIKKQVPVAAARYKEELFLEIALLRTLTVCDTIQR